MIKRIAVLFIGYITIFTLASASNYFTYVDSADIQIQRRDWVKAENSILSALKEEPANYNNSLLLSNLATIQRRQGRANEAIKNYSLAISMTPNAVTLLNNRGTLYYELDSINDALKDFERVMGLDGKDLNARYYYSLISIEEGNFKLAQDIIEQIAKINSKSEEYKIADARLKQALGKYEDAISIYTTLLASRVELNWLLRRAECYIEQGELSNALVDINDAIKIDPSMGYLYLIKAKVNKSQYQQDDAIKNMQLAIKYGIDRSYAQSIIDNKE